MIANWDSMLAKGGWVWPSQAARWGARGPGNRRRGVRQLARWSRIPGSGVKGLPCRQVSWPRGGPCAWRSCCTCTWYWISWRAGDADRRQAWIDWRGRSAADFSWRTCCVPWPSFTSGATPWPIERRRGRRWRAWAGTRAPGCISITFSRWRGWRTRPGGGSVRSATPRGPLGLAGACTVSCCSWP